MDDLWKANDDLITGFRIVATLDFDTRPICRALDGRMFPKDIGPRPPLMRRCRCVVVPMIRPIGGLDFNLLSGGTRASISGPVPADWTYYVWLTHQAPGSVERVLGPTLAKVFLRGGLTIERFTELQLDENFRPRTIKAMRSLEPGAFEMAQLVRSIL